MADKDSGTSVTPPSNGLAGTLKKNMHVEVKPEDLAKAQEFCFNRKILPATAPNGPGHNKADHWNILCTLHAFNSVGLPLPRPHAGKALPDGAQENPEQKADPDAATDDDFHDARAVSDPDAAALDGNAATVDDPDPDPQSNSSKAEPAAEEKEKLCQSMWGKKKCPGDGKCNRKHIPVCNYPTCLVDGDRCTLWHAGAHWCTLGPHWGTPGAPWGTPCAHRGTPVAP